MVRTSKIKFIIPETTQTVLKEVYSLPDLTGEISDPMLNTIEGWQVGREYIIDLNDLPTNAVMRYFLCAENKVDNGQQADGCFPSCYLARILFKIIE